MANDKHFVYFRVCSQMNQPIPAFVITTKKLIHFGFIHFGARYDKFEKCETNNKHPSVFFGSDQNRQDEG